MLMTYLGSVKSLLYVPILRVFGPTVYAIRLPMVLAGATTVWLLFVLMNRLAGPAIALLSAALLATDPTFLLCTTFDWGPVALQILLFTGAVFLLVRYIQQPNRWSLAIAAFLAGLALWNKAIFVWSLVGLMVAMLIVFPRRVVHALGLRAIAVAVSALVLGALPLIAYNLHNHAVTLTQNVHVATDVAWPKLGILRTTLDGSALFGYIVNLNPASSARGGTPTPTLAARLSAALSYPRRTLFPFAIAGSLLLLPFLWRSPLRDPALVALLFCVANYLQMFLTGGAGTSAHHVVLLDPAPHAFVALCFGGGVRQLRRVASGLLAGVGGLLAGSNLLVTTTYLALFSLAGSPPIWTDAIGPLAASLARPAPRQVFVMDWGILASLRLLSRGRLPLVMGSDALMSDPVSADTENRLVGWFTDRDCRFVVHSRGHEIFTGVRQRLDSVAARHGFQPSIDATISDSKGQPVFEVFHFAPVVELRVDNAALVNGPAASGGGSSEPRQRGAFCYQPQAAHWWFWDAFDLRVFANDIRHFRDGNLDTVTFDIQVKDFVDEAGPSPVLKRTNISKLVSAIRLAEKNRVKIILILWYTNGSLDPAYSGGARIVEPERFRSYLEMTRQLAAATRGHPVTFFFTNELFDFFATYDPAGKRFHLKPYPPASEAVASWARAQDPDLAKWNRSWGTSFPSWRSIYADAVYGHREYFDWLASVIRSRLPRLAEVIKSANPLAKVGYEDYAFVYKWGDSGIPKPCSLDYVGFGVYRDMVISSAELAEAAYQKLVAAYPGVEVFVPEVGMDTQRHSEAEQAEWFRSIADWARRRRVSINILMWRDYSPTPTLRSLEEAHYGLCRLDGSPKPALRVLGEVPRE
jgi:CBS domain-containing protein